MAEPEQPQHGTLRKSRGGTPNGARLTVTAMAIGAGVGVALGDVVPGATTVLGAVVGAAVGAGIGAALDRWARRPAQ